MTWNSTALPSWFVWQHVEIKFRWIIRLMWGLFQGGLCRIEEARTALWRTTSNLFRKMRSRLTDKSFCDRAATMSPLDGEHNQLFFKITICMSMYSVFSMWSNNSRPIILWRNVSHKFVVFWKRCTLFSNAYSRTPVNRPIDHYEYYCIKILLFNFNAIIYVTYYCQQ